MKKIKAKRVVKKRYGKNTVEKVKKLKVSKKRMKLMKEVVRTAEPFDIAQWCEDEGYRAGEWGRYNGKAEAEYCEVRCRDNSEVGICWYTNGKFVRIDGGVNPVAVEAAEVVMIRYYEQPLAETYEEDKEVEEEEPDDLDRPPIRDTVED